MKLTIPIMLELACWFSIGYKAENIAPTQIEPVCFTCDSLAEGTIFCDDFESETPVAGRYFEYDNNNGDFIRLADAGRDGSAGMRVVWQQGEVNAGSLKKSFGRTPDKYIGTNAPFSDRDFKEIYWRVDIKRQAGWQGGGGDKLTRATVLAGRGWRQGSIAHIWSNKIFW